MTKVFVVILNWNRPDDTIGCLKSVTGLRIKNYELEVVMVDNASTDGSAQRAINYLRKFVSGTKKTLKKKNGRVSQFRNNSRNISYEFIENRSNLGYAGGNNVGIKYALEQGADYVMVLNNDTRIHPDMMIRFISSLRNYSNFGAASPKIYFEKGFEFHKERYQKPDLGKVLWYAGGEIDWDNVYGKTRGVDEVDKGQYNKIVGTDFATGTCMFMSRKALKKAGLFDEKYFMYYEDTDLSLRIKRAGFKVLYVPPAVVWHKVAQSSGIGSDLNDYFITRNRLLFGMRYAKFRTRLALYKESLRLLWSGREWQKKGVVDFYIQRFGKGSWKEK